VAYLLESISLRVRHDKVMAIPSPAQKNGGVSKGHPFLCSFDFVELALSGLRFFLFVQKETNQRKMAPEKITSAFFGKMPLASRSQKRLKFAPFPFCHRTFTYEIIIGPNHPVRIISQNIVFYSIQNQLIRINTVK
jgi:hypothetical protein